MKTYNFTRVPNSVNEYTSDQMHDASGEYVSKYDVLNLIQNKLMEKALLGTEGVVVGTALTELFEEIA